MLSRAARTHVLQRAPPLPPLGAAAPPPLPVPEDPLRLRAESGGCAAQGGGAEGKGCKPARPSAGGEVAAAAAAVAFIGCSWMRAAARGRTPSPRLCTQAKRHARTRVPRLPRGSARWQRSAATAHCPCLTAQPTVPHCTVRASLHSRPCLTAPSVPHCTAPCPCAGRHPRRLGCSSEGCSEACRGVGIQACDPRQHRHSCAGACSGRKGREGEEGVSRKHRATCAHALAGRPTAPCSRSYGPPPPAACSNPPFSYNPLHVCTGRAARWRGPVPFWCGPCVAGHQDRAACPQQVGARTCTHNRLHTHTRTFKHTCACFPSTRASACACMPWPRALLPHAVLPGAVQSAA